MPLARITATSEKEAAAVAEFLAERGFDIQAASPHDFHLVPADLEINVVGLSQREALRRAADLVSRRIADERSHADAVREAAASAPIYTFGGTVIEDDAAVIEAPSSAGVVSAMLAQTRERLADLSFRVRARREQSRQGRDARSAEREQQREALAAQQAETRRRQQEARAEQREAAARLAAENAARRAERETMYAKQRAEREAALAEQKAAYDAQVAARRQAVLDAEDERVARTQTARAEQQQAIRATNPAALPVAEAALRKPFPPHYRRQALADWRTALTLAATFAVALMIGWAAAANGRPATTTPVGGDIQQQVPFGAVTVKPSAAASVVPAAPRAVITAPSAPQHQKPAAARPVASPRAARARSSNDVAEDTVIVRHFDAPKHSAAVQVSKAGPRRISDQ